MFRARAGAPEPVRPTRCAVQAPGAIAGRLICPYRLAA